MIPAPFLLYLGHSADPLGVKTSRGVATFSLATIRPTVFQRAWRCHIRLPTEGKSGELNLLLQAPVAIGERPLS